jgi:hypothetical protein
MQSISTFLVRLRFCGLDTTEIACNSVFTDAPNEVELVSDIEF